MRMAVAGGTGTVGRHVVASAVRRGHEVMTLSRRSGQDLTTGAGVRAALEGSDVVVDVTGLSTTSARRATEFFGRVTEVLFEAERAEDVGHHLALSIVGIDGIDAGYYAGKLAQERAVTASGRPWSILRAGQFHEFAEQVSRGGRLGPITVVPTILGRSVAAREVAEALVDVAEAGPSSRVRDLVGPEDDRVATMVRRMLVHDGVGRSVVEVSLPGRYWRGVRSGALRGGPDARHGTITFDEWLDSADHTP